MRHLRLRDNLGGAKGTVSRYLGWRKGNRGAASGALDLQRIRRNRCHLLGPEFEILFIRALLNFGGTCGNRLTAAAVGARKAAVTRFENEICRAPRTLIPMNFLWDWGGAGLIHCALWPGWRPAAGSKGSIDAWEIITSAQGSVCSQFLLPLEDG